jgi:hypothetical protein
MTKPFPIHADIVMDMFDFFCVCTRVKEQCSRIFQMVSEYFFKTQMWICQSNNEMQNCMTRDGGGGIVKFWVGLTDCALFVCSGVQAEQDKQE